VSTSLGTGENTRCVCVYSRARAASERQWLDQQSENARSQ